MTESPRVKWFSVSAWNVWTPTGATGGSSRIMLTGRFLKNKPGLAGQYS